MSSWADRMRLTQFDWSMILDGAQCNVYNENEVIVHAGDTQRAHIPKSVLAFCRVERENEHGETVLLGTMANLEMFGEISFLDPDESASVTVVADEDEVEVYVISKEYLESLFAQDEKERLIARKQSDGGAAAAAAAGFITYRGFKEEAQGQEGTRRRWRIRWGCSIESIVGPLIMICHSWHAD